MMPMIPSDGNATVACQQDSCALAVDQQSSVGKNGANDATRVGTIHIATPVVGIITSRSSGAAQQDSDEDDEEEEEHDEEEEDHEEPVELVNCPVILETFASLSCDPQRQNHWNDKVQSFRFTDFEGLDEFMLPSLRDLILQRHAPTLRLVHEKFQHIVQEIVETKQLAASLLDESTPVMVAPFATPNVRLKRGNYATFLHSDAVFGGGKQRNRAMINIWMPLTDAPSSQFPLCFHECDRIRTRFAENKLYYCSRHSNGAITNHSEKNDEENHQNEHLRMLYDPTLAWGSFLCFVAGQPASSDRVVLHGAVHLEELPTSLSSISTAIDTTANSPDLVERKLRAVTLQDEKGGSRRRLKETSTAKPSCHERELQRKSLEMRFLM